MDPGGGPPKAVRNYFVVCVSCALYLWQSRVVGVAQWLAPPPQSRSASVCVRVWWWCVCVGGGEGV